MTVAGMDLNLLIALRAMLEEANVTRAGERIGMAQPAMSTALARLRRHYRDDLLVRVGRDYELTPFARSLLPLVEQTLPMIEQALALRDEFDAATSDRTFSIILSDYAFAVISGSLLRQISRLAPHVRVEFGPIPWDMHVSDRGLLRYDILVGPLGCGFPGQSAVLFHDRFVCVTDPAPGKAAMTSAARRRTRSIRLSGVIGGTSRRSICARASGGTTLTASPPAIVPQVIFARPRTGSRYGRLSTASLRLSTMRHRTWLASMPRCARPAWAIRPDTVIVTQRSPICAMRSRRPVGSRARI